MKVLDLQCSRGHPFEGWFAGEDDYRNQNHLGLLICPVCEDRVVEKMLSAPRLNLGATRASGAVETPFPEARVDAEHPDRSAILKTWLELSRKILNSTEDVGDRFSEEARKIHYGESEQRGIRGKASAEQFKELLDEGVEVMPLMVPDSVKQTRQ